MCRELNFIIVIASSSYVSILSSRAWRKIRALALSPGKKKKTVYSILYIYTATIAYLYPRYVYL